MPNYPAKHPPGMEPAHPGDILREGVFPSLELTISEAARQLGVSRSQLSSVLSARSSVSPEMAVRLGKFCSNGADFWLRLQAAYDLWHAERKLEAELRNIPAHHAVA